MKHFTAHRPVGRWLFACLLLAFSLPVFSQQCPAYPRAMDQVYICLDNEGNLTLDQNATLHNPVRFTFPTFPATITELTFDVGDGNGPVNITSGEIKTVSYTTPAQVTIQWNITCPSCSLFPFNPGSTTFQTNFNPGVPYSTDPENIIPSDELNVKAYTPSPGGAYPGSPSPGPITAGGIVHILYANPDHQLRKPFILAEGFDPILGPSDQYVVNNLEGATLGFGEVRWDIITTGRRESFDVNLTEPGVPHTPQFALFPTLLADLQARGYDIIFVDFEDGGNYLQANAEYLIAVLEWVNSKKITDEPNVFLGASMGGIIGRYALAKLESEGKSHCTGLFFTLDSPHNGANIPLSLQALGWYFHYAGDTDEAWNAMETPGARQMLIQHLGAAVQEGLVTPENDDLAFTTDVDFAELYSADYSILRNQFNAELASLGWPKFPRKVGLSDGMKDGTLNNGQGFSPGQKYYESRGYAEPLNFGTVFRLFLRSNNGGGSDFYSINGMIQDCLHYSDHGFSDNHLFTIARPHDFNPCYGSDVPFLYHVWRLRATGDLPFLDNAPGGFRMDLRAVHDKLKTDIGSSVDYQNPINFPKVTFVPTWSGLAMGTPLTNDNLFVNLKTSEFEEENLPSTKLPNFDNFYAPNSSLRHVELDEGMVAFILEEVDGLNAAPQPGILTQVYNYGKRYKEIPNTTVSSTGILLINNPGPTGYIQSNPQDPAVKPTFTTYLNSCGQNITVENGGQYIIGAVNRSQHGVTEVWEGGTVHIKTGGTLRITSEQSQLWIKKGATLILDAGAIVNLESPGSEILINGDLVVKGDIDFKGQGYFHFSTGNRLIYGAGYSNFKLKGAGTDKRFVRLSADLIIQDGKRLNWSIGLLEAAGGAVILNTAAGLDFKLMTLTGGTNQGLTAVEAHNSGAVKLDGCFVKNLDLPILGSQGLGCNIINCEFSKYFIGISWDDTWSVNVAGSIFNGIQNPGAIALKMTDVRFLLLSFSNFNDHIDPSLSGATSDGSLSNANPAIDLDNMVACLVKGCGFSRNSIGIKGDNPNTATTANVYTYQGTSFTKNMAGIYVVGDDVQGAVLADCVYFIENRNGIRGKDITLMIDSKNSKMFDFDTDSPNHFIKKQGGGPGSTENHVHICYDLKMVGGSNLMRNNFWGITAGGAVMVDLAPLPLLNLKDGNCQDKIAQADLPNVANGNSLCGYGLGGGNPSNFSNPYPGTECTLYVNNPGNNIPVAVHEQFHLGTYLMQTDSIEQAITAFRPVAAIWQPNMAGYAKNCQQYIQVAKAFVDASDQVSGNGLRPSAERAQQLTTGSLLIAPNPAENFAMLHLPEAQHTIKVWDAQGQVRHQNSASGTYRLDTSDWKSGIYFIETVAADGNRRSAKLVVQR